MRLENVMIPLFAIIMRVAVFCQAKFRFSGKPKWQILEGSDTMLFEWSRRRFIKPVPDCFFDTRL